MTFSELQTMCYQLLREKSTNTSVDSTTLKALINTAYTIVTQFLPWKAWETVTTRTVPSTTVASLGSATSLVVADATGFAAGQTICVYASNRYDYAVISSISTNTMTLVSPGILYAHTTASKVVPISFAMPENSAVHQIKWRKVAATGTPTAKRLVGVDRSSIDKYDPYYSGAGEPTVFYYDTYSTYQYIKVLPVPDAACYLDIYYRSNSVTALSGDSDTPVIDVQYHSAIGFMAGMLIGIRNKDQELASMCKDMYVMTMTLAQSMFCGRMETNSSYDFSRGVSEQ